VSVSYLTSQDRSDAVAFGAVALAERAYRRAEHARSFLSHISLWPVVLLFLPKINLMSFGGETAGIRLDDIVLFLVVAVLLCGWITGLRFQIDSVAAVSFGVIGIFCLSNLVNLEHSNVLYSLRLVEYLVFFWAGKSVVRFEFDFDSIVKLLVVVNCIAIVLQFAGVLGGFTAEGYTSHTERPFGLSANHPAEMGALLNLLFAALVFEERNKTSPRFWLWCVVIAVCIFITESRSALAVHCLLTWLYTHQHAKNKTGFVLKSAFISGALLAGLVLVPNPVRERSSDLLSPQNVEAARQLYDSVPAEKQFSGFAGSEAEDAPQEVDVSAYMRGFKWIYVAKIMFTAPWFVWILGLGPGALGPALDGGWLRLLAEAGVVGTVAFLALLRKIAGLSRMCAMAILSLAVNMIMVDSQNAYKVMAFLFLLAGVQAQKTLLQSRTRTSRGNPYSSPLT
jgi:hypothetical protein